MPAEITPIDLSVFLERKEGFEAECEKVGRFLHKYGILLVRDPVRDSSFFVVSCVLSLIHI